MTQEQKNQQKVSPDQGGAPQDPQEHKLTDQELDQMAGGRMPLRPKDLGTP